MSGMSAVSISSFPTLPLSDSFFVALHFAGHPLFPSLWRWRPLPETSADIWSSLSTATVILWKSLPLLPLCLASLWSLQLAIRPGYIAVCAWGWEEMGRGVEGGEGGGGRGVAAHVVWIYTRNGQQCRTSTECRTLVHTWWLHCRQTCSSQSVRRYSFSREKNGLVGGQGQVRGGQDRWEGERGLGRLAGLSQSSFVDERLKKSFSKPFICNSKLHPV